VPTRNPCLDRISSDLSSVTATIQNLCPKITGNSIKDCTRLGNKANSNQLLVTLVRSHDTSFILANRHKVPARSSYAIKPLMTLEERANESALLWKKDEPWLTQVSKEEIRLKQSSIYVNGKKHVTPTGFKRCSQMSNLSASTDQQTMQSWITVHHINYRPFCPVFSTTYCSEHQLYGMHTV